jgi:hypothetical protein
MQSAEKDETNPHFQSAYATLAAVWDACRAPLSKHGLSVVQATEPFAGGMLLHTRLMHSTGQFIESVYEVRPTQATPQGFGSALTYARRYSLMALVGVAADDDDDGNEASKKGKTNVATNPKSPAASGGPVVKPKAVSSPPPAAVAGPSPSGPSEPQLARLFAIANGRGWTNDNVKAFMKARFGKESSKALAPDEYQLLVSEIEKFEFDVAMGDLQ